MKWVNRCAGIPESAIPDISINYPALDFDLYRLITFRHSDFSGRTSSPIYPLIDWEYSVTA